MDTGESQVSPSLCSCPETSAVACYISSPGPDTDGSTNSQKRGRVVSQFHDCAPRPQTQVLSKRRCVDTALASSLQSETESWVHLQHSSQASLQAANVSTAPSTLPASTPLTHENLKKFQMSQAGADPNTPTGSRSAKSSTVSASSTQSARMIRERLATYEILIDTIAWDEDQEIRAFINQVVFQKRHSPGLSEDAQERLTRTVRAVKNMEEGNVTLALVDLIYPRPEYLEDGKTLLLRNHNVDFAPNTIPKPDAEDNPVFQAALLAAGLPKNPKPDFAFGASDHAFDRDQNHINKIFPQIASISKGILYPFLVIEWKSSASRGTQYDAQNQAARSGAALVYSLEQLKVHARSGPDSEPLTGGGAGSLHGGDHILNPTRKAQTAVFSNTLDSDSAYLWVHWRQVDASTAIESYHMSLVKKYWLDEADDIWALRRTIDNIFDWGLGRRLEMIKSLLKTVSISPSVPNARKRKAGD